MYNKQLTRGGKSHKCESDSDDIPKKKKPCPTFKPEFHFSDPVSAGILSRFIGQGQNFSSGVINAINFVVVAYPICQNTTITEINANIKFFTNITNISLTFFLVTAPCGA